MRKISHLDPMKSSVHAGNAKGAKSARKTQKHHCVFLAFFASFFALFALPQFSHSLSLRSISL
jgi:hypothetical protein